jgi:hypothetical protein
MSESPPADPSEWEGWVDGLTAKQLKSLIASRGLKYSDCVEKADFRVRALDALRTSGGGDKKSASAAPASMKVSIGHRRRLHFW